MRVCVGQILGAHGVRGLVKLTSFTVEPQGLTAYGALTDAEGSRSFDLELLSAQKGHWLARLKGVEDREAAQALSGLRLYVDRDRLPEVAEDEFYHADLIGLTVEDRAGKVLGKVAAIHNFGAGDVLEVEAESGERPLFPFTKAVVPIVDLPGKRIVVEVPAAMAGDEPP
ncbi:MAG TPA: ribosome maturation factor RimM [Alphaproteobacteria bacterium]|nr:ribosome maturation factor RimM [Alphaproteobacteria bacterium]